MIPRVRKEELELYANVVQNYIIVLLSKTLSLLRKTARGSQECEYSITNPGPRSGLLGESEVMETPQTEK